MQTIQPVLQTDTTPGRVLTITRVKTPWYAPRFLMLRGFRKSIPEYRQIDGLLRKVYALIDGGAYFGGIYLWQSRADAQSWFNERWFSRVQKTYGLPGTVDYYTVIRLTDVAQVAPSEGSYRAVLSVSGEPIAGGLSAGPGLLRLIEVRTATGQAGLVTFWQTKADATAFIGHNPAAHTLFDTPVFLDNIPLQKPHVAVSH